MNYKEFGSKGSKTIIFLHGGGLSWWNYREEAEMLKNEYHIIVPILDGHAGSDRHFSTIESNAQDIALFINENLGGSVFMLCGLSLGGQILLEMLSQQGDICDHAIIESAPAIPSRLTNALIRPVFGCSYPLIKQKWFAKMQFSQLKIKSELFDDYYRDTCAVQKKDMLAFLKANTSYRLKESIKNCAAKVNVFYGEKESPKIKKSAKLICGVIPLSTLTELPGMHHGDFSINNSPDYVRTIKAVSQKI